MHRRSSSIPPAVGPYGATELKEYEPRALALSFGLSVIILSSTISIMNWALVVPSLEPVRPRPPVIEIYRPPGIVEVPGTGHRQIPKFVSSFAIPIPVPFEEIDTSSIFPTTEQLAWTITEASDPGEGVGGVADPVVEVEPKAFEPREVDPVVVRSVMPVYPALAIQAGLEGNVYVKVWVDKLGLVRKAGVVKSDGEIFEEPALTAARHWVFTPALMQDQPVSVWVTIPIRFRLRSQSE